MSRNLLLLAAMAGPLLLLGTQSCKKEEQRSTVPYYQFTEDDLRWTALKIGDEWTFETSSGKQQKYVVFDVQEETKRPYVRSNFGGIITGPSRALYYYDKTRIDIKRLDTLSYNSLEFRRTLPAGADPENPPQGNGEFKFGGLWRNYVGSWNYKEIYGNLTVYPGQLIPQNASAIEINGKVYDRVISISASQPGSFGAEKPYIQVLYYAQQAGVIRMISATGETWDRVP